MLSFHKSEVRGRLGLEVELDAGFANLLFRTAKILPASIGPFGEKCLRKTEKNEAWPLPLLRF